MLAINTALMVAGAGLLLQLSGCAATPDAATRSGQSAQTPRDLDTALAPIALYPDSLLAQILMCAQDPGSVAKLDEWLKGNASLKGTKLQDAAVVAGFEPSFVALAVFPQVVASMAEKLQWTTLVGQLFTSDRSAVFASIQKLRAQAHDVGNLKTTSQQTVETKTTPGGEQVIVIEPSNPQVIYVPQYNPTVVYTQPATTTVVVESQSNADVVAAGVIGFTAGVVIGAAVNTPYYYGPMGFHGGAYMYNDAWDDYYDHREDAREDYLDHREDLAENRGDRANDAREQRTDRTETRQDQRTDRTQTRSENRPQTQAATQQRRTDAQTQAQQRGSGNAEARGFSGSGEAATAQRSGTTRSDAFSGYSSGQSQRAESQRGTQSRSSSRSSGGSRSRSGGGGGGRRR
jgi:hypothetical protein